MKNKISLLVACMAISATSYAADQKVECPDLQGSYVCGIECDGTNTKGCISDTDLFGRVDGELTQNNVAQLGFQIKQSVGSDGATSYDFGQPGQQFTGFGEKKWGDNATVMTACMDKTSFIMQLSTKDMVYGTNGSSAQWINTYSLSSQVFSKNEKGQLVVTKSEAHQNVTSGSALTLKTQRLVCKPAKFQE